MKTDAIAALTGGQIALVAEEKSSLGFGLETERNVSIVITGPYESVEQAKVRYLVLLDEQVCSSFLKSPTKAS